MTFERPLVVFAYDFDGTLAPGNMQEHVFIPDELGMSHHDFWEETKALAKAFAPAITVNSVAPGVILFEPGDERAEGMIRSTPARRAGKPEEVAEAVRYFLEAGDFITGQVLAVDGGLSQK